MIKKETYIAFDGKEFSNAIECQKYEASFKPKKIICEFEGNDRGEWRKCEWDAEWIIKSGNVEIKSCNSHVKYCLNMEKDNIVSHFNQ